VNTRNDQQDGNDSVARAEANAAPVTHVQEAEPVSRKEDANNPAEWARSHVRGADSDKVAAAPGATLGKQAMPPVSTAGGAEPVDARPCSVTNPDDVKSREIEELRDELGRAQRENARLREQLARFYDRQDLYERNDPDRFRQLHEFERRIRSECEQSLSKLRADLQVAQTERDDFKARVSKLLREQHTADGRTVYRVNDNRPHHELADRFRQLRDQEFQAAAASLFKILGAAVRERRREIMADVKARLAFLLFNESWDDAADARPPALRIKLRITENLRQVYPVESGLPSEFDDLIPKARLFVEDIRQAAPPGHLWFDEPLSTFEPSRHECVPGYAESGVVKMTLFPGYSAGDRVFEKAQVTTMDLLVGMQRE